MLEMCGRIIDLENSVVPACDVDTLEHLIRLVDQTRAVKRIGGYKLDLLGSFAMNRGIDLAVEVTRALTDKPLILDLQKAGNDIPDLASGFAGRVLSSGVDAVILFPFAGALTQTEWTRACLGEGIKVISGGEMTHKQFLRSEGGYIADDAPDDMYRLAVELGVRDFVIPGNKVEKCVHYTELLTKLCDGDPFRVYAPGFIAQGGDISETGKALGDIEYHAIVGRGILQANDMYAAALEYTSQLAG